MNTLSFLEYIGARKILKSQKQESISSELLAHISEEIRHAQILKKVALKLSNGTLVTYSEEHLLCGRQAVRYAQQVDHAAEKLWGGSDHWQSYLYTTLLLEERANQLYPLYDEALEATGRSTVFQGILREEALHLESVLGSLGVAPTVPPNSEVQAERLNALRTFEEAAFAEFLTSLEAQVSSATIPLPSH